MGKICARIATCDGGRQPNPPPSVLTLPRAVSPCSRIIRPPRPRTSNDMRLKPTPRRRPTATLSELRSPRRRSTKPRKNRRPPVDLVDDFYRCRHCRYTRP